MRLPKAAAGRSTVLAGVAVLSLSGCASKPAPLPPSETGAGIPSGVLAVAGRDTLTQARFETQARQVGVPAQGNSAATLGFWDEFVRYSLENQAAQDAGLTADPVRQRRWASIKERILSDRYSQEIVQGQFGFSDSVLASRIAADSVLRGLPVDSARRVAARRLAMAGVNYDSVMKANIGMFRRQDSTVAPLDSARNSIERIYLSAKAQRDLAEIPTTLRSRYKVDLPKLERPAVPQDSLETFYRRNRDRWSGVPMYVLSALASKDSAALRTAVLGKKKPTTKDAFQAMAAKFPVGTPVAPKGELGRVKRNFALPYGVGMLPDLFPILDTAKPGVAGIVRSDSQWIAIWLERRDSAVTKPFAQVAEDVRNQYNAEFPWTPSASAVVAKWDRGVLFTKADVDFIAEEVPAHMKRQFPFERVLDFMVRWKLGARAAVESGLLARPGVQGVLRDNESVYWSQAWRQSREAVSFVQADSVLARAWKSHASIFPTGKVEDTAAGVNRDAARLAVMPSGFLQERYDLRPDSWMRDSVLLPFDSVSGRIYREARAELDQLGRARMDSVLKARYRFVATKAAPQVKSFASLREMSDSARAAYDRRDLDAAEGLFRRIEKEYPKGDTLVDKALFQMGQLQGEKQNYPASLEAYRKLLKLRPQSPEAYKAQFMIAFTYSEYLKKERLAVAEYRKVLANYPTCELAKDADWMIRNIESGGALMPKFDDSLATDSAVQDTAKAPAKSVVAKDSAKPETAPAAVKVQPAAKEAAKAPAIKPEAKDSAKAVRTIGRTPVKTLAPAKPDSAGTKAR